MSVGEVVLGAAGFLPTSQRSWLSMVRGSSDISNAPHHPGSCCARIWPVRGVCPRWSSPGPWTAGGRVTAPWWGASSIAPSHPMMRSVPPPLTPLARHASSRLDASLPAVSGPPLAGGRSIVMLSPPRKHLVPAVRECRHTACRNDAWTGDCTRSRAPRRAW